ncbi:unnamed protein product [Dovyalis caffra]|uniref:Serine-threonine/tyrosine-protein kinase catalytic domain-containing protein n=1 Tax=Dovyalis caffra TaxID=77055 RepID=A0AAV1S572_9ROSI|nr:unnamed protein product [Dovyalis caffra]
MTVKVDVYSFGILLLEIVSGRSNADYRENQETVFLLDTDLNFCPEYSRSIGSKP